MDKHCTSTNKIALSIPYPLKLIIFETIILFYHISRLIYYIHSQKDTDSPSFKMRFWRYYLEFMIGESIS